MCGVKKCAEIIFKIKKRIVKGEELQAISERTKALDPEKNEVYKFLGCEQADESDMEKVMERTEAGMKKRTTA